MTNKSVPEERTGEVWVTKSLSPGEPSKRPVRFSPDHPSMVTDLEYVLTHYHKPDWYESEDEAWERIEKMANARLKALAKEREKLEKILQRRGKA